MVSDAISVYCGSNASYSLSQTSTSAAATDVFCASILSQLRRRSTLTAPFIVTGDVIAVFQIAEFGVFLPINTSSANVELSLLAFFAVTVVCFSVSSGLSLKTLSEFQLSYVLNSPSVLLCAVTAAIFSTPLSAPSR